MYTFSLSKEWILFYRNMSAICSLAYGLDFFPGSSMWNNLGQWWDSIPAFLLLWWHVELCELTHLKVFVVRERRLFITICFQSWGALLWLLYGSSSQKGRISPKYYANRILQSQTYEFTCDAVFSHYGEFSLRVPHFFYNMLIVNYITCGFFFLFQNSSLQI